MGYQVRTCIRALWCAKTIPWLPLCTGCYSVPPASNVPVQDKDFGQSMDWDASDALVLSILSPGGKISHHGRPGSVLERGRNFLTSGGSV
jgi:hypothetical protein